ncbi:hypothetical protein GF406_04850 [candidate division KSB1 bacterium]|nr:hypothetical protein [candidate division KSB1 bacterium]
MRINDKNVTGRIVFRIDPDAIVILHVFDKKNGPNTQTDHRTLSKTNQAL